MGGYFLIVNIWLLLQRFASVLKACGFYFDGQNNVWNDESWPKHYKRHEAELRIEPVPSWIAVSDLVGLAYCLAILNNENSWPYFKCLYCTYLLSCVLERYHNTKRAVACQNQQDGMLTCESSWQVCPAKTQNSLGICPVWSVFTVYSTGSWGPNASSCRQRRLWSDWADAQADLSLPWGHISFC